MPTTTVVMGHHIVIYLITSTRGVLSTFSILRSTKLADLGSSLVATGSHACCTDPRTTLTACTHATNTLSNIPCCLKARRNALNKSHVFFAFSSFPPLTMTSEVGATSQAVQGLEKLGYKQELSRVSAFLLSRIQCLTL
jgi:hypothetical protein